MKRLSKKTVEAVADGIDMFSEALLRTTGVLNHADDMFGAALGKSEEEEEEVEEEQDEFEEPLYCGDCHFEINKCECGSSEGEEEVEEDSLPDLADMFSGFIRTNTNRKG